MSLAGVDRRDPASFWPRVGIDVVHAPPVPMVQSGTDDRSWGGKLLAVLHTREAGDAKRVNLEAVVSRAVLSEAEQAVFASDDSAGRPGELAVSHDD